MSASVESSNIASVAQQYSYASDILAYSVNVSKNLYARVGLNLQYLEAKALQVNELSTSLATAVDQRVNNTLNVVTNARKQLVQHSKQRVEAIAANSVVLRKADDYTKSLLSEIEVQIEQLAQSVKARHGESKDNQLAVVSSQNSQSDLAIDQLKRAQSILIRLNEIGKFIATSYIQNARKFSVVQSAFSTCEEVAVFGRNAVASVASAAEVVYEMLVLEYVIRPLFNTLSVNYTYAKDTVIVTLNNVKKQVVDQVLLIAKDSYSSLKQATIQAVDHHKLQLVFVKNYFATSFVKIQNDIASLLTDVTAMTARFQEAALNLYAKSIEEFKKKRAQKLQIKHEEAEQQVEDLSGSTDEAEESQEAHQEEQENNASQRLLQ